MKTECPHCGQHYEVDDQYIGQVVECTTCGKDFTIKTSSDNAVIQPQNNCEKMKALVCEMCGSTDLIKQNGLFICQSCGIKYSLEEARKMMIDGTVNVAGTVKVDKSESLKNLYTLARRAKDENNSKNAEKYYDMILLEDPKSWEASFYQVYFKAMDFQISEIDSVASSIDGCLKNTFSLISQQIQDKTERDAIFSEIMERSTIIATKLADAAWGIFQKQYSQIKNLMDINNEPITREYVKNIFASAKICYTLGDLLESQSIKNLSCIVWKKAIDIHTRCIRFVPYTIAFGCGGERDSHNAIINKYTAKIGRTEPHYKKPSSGCYIATAVYGSYDCPEVWTLRRFRDYSLGQCWYGRLIIKMYYAVSPSLVKLFGHTKVFQLFWKKELDKLVEKLNSHGVSSAPYNDRSW